MLRIHSVWSFRQVIVLPTLSEKTKESKSLARSFKHIYKVAGFGLATGLSGLFSLSQVPQDQQVKIDMGYSGDLTSPAKSDEMSDSSKYFVDESLQSKSGSASIAESEHAMGNPISEDLKHGALDVVDSAIDPNVVIAAPYDMHVLFAIVSMILGGFTICYLYKFFT